jgi:hypothetical protein
MFSPAFKMRQFTESACPVYYSPEAVKTEGAEDSFPRNTQGFQVEIFNLLLAAGIFYRRRLILSFYKRGGIILSISYLVIHYENTPPPPPKKNKFISCLYNFNIRYCWGIFRL